MMTSNNDKTNNNQLAAQSAQTSRKRSRILFSKNNARQIYIPSVDVSSSSTAVHVTDMDLYKQSIARRVRLQYPVIPSSVCDPSTTNTSTSNSTTGDNLTSRILKELKEKRLDALKQQSLLSSSTTTTNKLDSNSSSQIILHRETDLIGLASSSSPAASVTNNALALPGQTIIPSNTPTTTTTTSNTNNTINQTQPCTNTNSNTGILVKKPSFTNTNIPTPTWHAPWKLTTVISSHLGWVRSIDFDPTNDMFATGSADRTIKIFDFAKACIGSENALKLTLTGHLSPVRGLAFSPRHPYLFSAGEDKLVKCWDLETNQVVRHYHGHLSGVFDLKLHPTLDILVTGGRDAVARVWDMRTKQQIHCLSGHDNTVGAILTKSTDPQIITASYDSTIKLWDLVAGKCMSTLTHHKKAVRALAQPSFESTFLSGAADTIKKWQAKEGRFIKNFTGHSSIINSLAINDDGVVVSGADDGTMNFWDYKTGYTFQKTETVAQPGSLDAENGIYVAKFDLSGTRLITGEADKSIKIWKQDEGASELTHPVDMMGWKKKCLAEAKQRY